MTEVERLKRKVELLERARAVYSEGKDLWAARAMKLERLLEEAARYSPPAMAEHYRRQAAEIEPPVAARFQAQTDEIVAIVTEMKQLEAERR